MLNENMMTFDEWQIFNTRQGIEMPADVRMQYALYEKYTADFVKGA